MELTKQEERLIGAIRAYDIVNPMGAEGRTSAGMMSSCLCIAEGCLDAAKNAHERFLEESKNDRFVDLAYYRAPIYADGNRYENGKQVFKRFGDNQEISAPEISEPEKPIDKRIFEDDITGPDKPIEEWTEEDHEALEAELWEKAEEGCVEYAVKTLAAPATEIETALKILEAIWQNCKECAARENLNDDFYNAPGHFIVRTISRRVRIDQEAGQASAI